MAGNANFTPLGASKPWLKSDGASSSAPPAMAGMPPQPVSGQIGVQGEVLARVTPLVTGACTKCGYIGHLPFQCRNFIQLKPNQKTDIDVSSTSSEEYTTHLKEEKKRLKKKKKEEKKEMKKLEKRLRKELKKKKRKRKHSTSSTSSDEDDDHHRKKAKKKDKDKGKSKKKHRRRSRSSSSSDTR